MTVEASRVKALNIFLFMWRYVMDQLLSPKQVANAIGASESSLKRWCDQGLLKTVKTAGGHRRIPVQEALRFARERNIAAAEPHLLAMVATTDRKARRVENGPERLIEALLGGNETLCNALVLEYFQAGVSASRIFDDIVTPAFRTLGEKWECKALEIYEERSACQIMLRILHELRLRQPAPVTKRIAMGATCEGDPYSLPIMMGEVVLRSVGWDTRLLGCSIPLSSVSKAIQQHQPAIFWLSVSSIVDPIAFINEFNQLSEAASKSNTAIVVGGRVLTTEIRTRLRYSAFCDTMQHLEEFAKTLQHRST